MANSESKSFNLVLIQIIGPALIMVMVASLVFFLIEVFYRGPHAARLYWVMSFFTFASVLVSRVSIEEGKERAWLLGFLLAGATFVSCSSLVVFQYGGLGFLSPVVILGLIATVMWSSAKLTWDCTVVDNSRDPSATGLVDLLQTSVKEEIRNVKDEDRVSLVQRWLGTPRKNNPGLWVFYFAIFAFPVFGFGQWFVETRLRGWTYGLFAIYLAATLCLLMTTSLLGLQRYLSKRKLQVPSAIARNWVLTGGAFALLVMLVVIFIPKPPSAGWSNDLAALLKSPDRDGWKQAPGNDGRKNDPDAHKKKADPNAKGPAEAEGGEQEGGKKKSDQGGGDDKGESNDKSGKPQRDQKEAASKKAAKAERQKNRDGKNEANSGKKRQLDKNNANNKNANQPKPPQAQQQPQTNPLNKLFESLSSMIQGLVYLIGVIAAAVLVFMFKDQLLTMFARKPAKKSEPSQTPQTPIATLPPFRSFQDPFLNGRAGRMSVQQLLEYTLSAFQAWSRDAGIQQGPEDTASELAKRVRTTDERVAKYARLLAELYGRVAYGGKDEIGREELKPLVKLWRVMSASNQKGRADLVTH